MSRDPAGVVVRRIADPRNLNGTRVAAKGGKGAAQQQAPPPQHQPVEFANTLRSLSTARILEVLSEGVIYGPAYPWASWWQCVFLDGTPLMDEAGNWQFTILSGDVRYGYPSQDAIAGFPWIEDEQNVSVQAKFGIPIVREVNTPVHAIRYKLQIPALWMTEDDGDINGASVAYAFDVRTDGGPWTNIVTEAIWGKTNSPYIRSVVAGVPYTTGTQEIRIERLSPDVVVKTTNDLIWSSYTEMLYQQLAYDDTAVISIAIDAQQFPTIPNRSYLLDGIMVQIPTNYDPRLRQYNGDWNGQFYIQWTNNPAWILYALLTNERWGLGRYLDGNMVDKWSFYECAQYCDGYVPKDTGGAEPRFTFNGIINTRQDAFAVLQAVASNMLGQLYYANGTIFLVMDRPGNPTRLFTPSDVENGLFDYAGADIKSRWNAVPVQWVDPADTYNPATELVQDPNLVATQSYRESNTVIAYGCTSRSQAQRLGRWTIYTNQYETELATFRVGLENADLRPGEIVLISDPSRVGARLGGRLLDDTGAGTITLDAVPQAMVDHPEYGWSIYITAGTAADATKPTVYGVSLTGLPTTPGGQQIRVSGKPSPTAFPPGSNWLASSSAVVPTKWRVATVSDKGSGLYEILATEYHDEKFYYVDYANMSLVEPPFTLLPTGPLGGASNLGFKEYIYLDGTGFPQFGVLMSWTASTDGRVTRYQLEMSGPNADHRIFRGINSVGQDVPLMRQGQWAATVTAFDNLGRASAPLTITFIPIGLSAVPLPPANMFLAPNGNLTTVSWIPTGELDVVYFWLKWSPVTDGSATWERATTSIARVGVDTTQINTPTRAGTYMVKSIDSLGQESDDATMAILLPQVTELVHVTDIEEQPLWLGDRGTFWHLNMGELWLPPPDAPEPIPPGIFPGDRGVALNQTPTRVGVYGFTAPPLDLGIVCSNVSVVGLVQAYGTFLGTVMAKWVPLASPIADPIASGANNTMSAWIPLATAVPLAMGSSDQWDGHIECAVSQDGATYAPWFPLKSTQITGRAFQFRLIGTVYDLLTTMRTVRAAVILQIPLRNIGDNDVPMDGTGHLVVTYAVPFLDTPTVQITARQGLVAGGNIVVIESDRNHFKVEHRNPAGVATAGGSVDYFVQGYGGHQ